MEHDGAGDAAGSVAQMGPFRGPGGGACGAFTDEHVGRSAMKKRRTFARSSGGKRSSVRSF